MNKHKESCNPHRDSPPLRHLTIHPLTDKGRAACHPGLLKIGRGETASTADNSAALPMVTIIWKPDMAKKRTSTGGDKALMNTLQTLPVRLERQLAGAVPIMDTLMEIVQGCNESILQRDKRGGPPHVG